MKALEVATIVMVNHLARSQPTTVGKHIRFEIVSILPDGVNANQLVRVFAVTGNCNQVVLDRILWSLSSIRRSQDRTCATTTLIRWTGLFVLRRKRKKWNTAGCGGREKLLQGNRSAVNGPRGQHLDLGGTSIAQNPPLSSSEGIRADGLLRPSREQK